MLSQLDCRLSLKRDRYEVQIGLVTRVGMFKIVVTFDTGALYTVLPYSCFGMNLSAIRTGTYLGLKGSVDSEIYRAYEIDVEQCYIGGIDMGSQHVYVTYDKRIKVPVIGMDLLKKLNFTQVSAEQCLYLQDPGKPAAYVFSAFDTVDSNNILIALRQAATEMHAAFSTVKDFFECLPKRVDMKYCQLCGLLFDFASRAS